MTIASYCVGLIRERGPLTAEELGQAIREAGLSAARDPAMSATSALSWSSDGRALRIGDRFHLVTSLLDGRWLTFRRPEVAKPFPHDVDLAPLSGLAGREDIPVRGGGVVASTRRRGWTTVTCELPPGEYVGMRLHDGMAELVMVEIDDDARHRGDELAGLLRGTTARLIWSPDSRDLAKSLLELVQRDDDVLRAPVPPLSELFPEHVPKPVLPEWGTPLPHGHQVAKVVLPDEVHEAIAEVASRDGETVGQWLSTEVSRLVWWPHSTPRDRDPSNGWPDPELRDDFDASVGVLRFPR